jgi:N-hydroxyarylamine O-acetyltransferase
MSNWYLSNHPNSHFVTGLMAARPERDCRYALRNSQLTIHRLHGDAERRMLTTAAEIRAVLEDAFHITLPITPDLDPAWQRLITQAENAS